MAASSEQDNVPPVPQHSPIRAGDDPSDNKSLVIRVWANWFERVRVKINLINESIANLAGISGNGFLVGSSSNWVFRAIQGVAGQIQVTNGDGVGGDPTIGLVDTTVTPGTYGAALKTPTITVDAKGRITTVVDNGSIETALAGKLAVPSTTSTTATAGAASALPATPLGYMTLTIDIAGVPTAVKVPYYSV